MSMSVGRMVVLGAMASPALAFQPPAEPVSKEKPPAQEETLPPPKGPMPPIIVKAPPKPAPGAGFANADELLVTLEDADKGMRTLVADISYDKVLATVGDRQTRLGKLYFDNGVGGAGRRFAIRFDKLYTGPREESDPEIYVFDGQWLLQKHPKAKWYEKRQVVPPGQKFDPLKIGEGPFPIPIGQKRDDILARYNAELLKPEEGLNPKDKDQADLISFVAGSYQLRLVPRADRPDQDKFKEIRLWYRADKGGNLLPVMARTIQVSPEPGEDGDESLVRLLNVKLNLEIPPGETDTATPPAAEGWDGQVVDFREPTRK